MNITYIGHSGFLMDTGSAYFLFDYYNGIIPEMDTSKPLIVFTSHKHQDHFNPGIFRLADIYPGTLFVLAKGVPYKNLAVKYSKNIASQGDFKNILPVKKDISLDVILSNGEKLGIRTLRSTDEGVAFLLLYNGKRYYHAGDLNLWIWDSETEEYNRNMEKRYITEMEKLKGMEIDIAFVPLDPRVGDNAYAGLKTFLSYVHCKHVFPMHCWGNYGIIDSFIEEYPEYKEQIVKILYENQCYRF